MTNEQADWLLSCANKLRGNNYGSVNLSALLDRFAIEVRHETSKSGGAFLTKAPSGRGFIITLRLKPALATPLHKERFTLAHELGHVLLIKKFGLTQVGLNRTDYYKFEAICNEFAGQLLVDSRYINEKTLNNADDLVRYIYHLSLRFNVSLQVASMRLALAKTNMVIAGFIYPPLAADPLLAWGYSSLAGFRMTAKIKLRKDPPLEILKRWCEKCNQSSMELSQIDFCSDLGRTPPAIIGGYKEPPQVLNLGRYGGEILI